MTSERAVEPGDVDALCDELRDAGDRFVATAGGTPEASKEAYGDLLAVRARFRAATPNPPNGWQELRREIEALPVHAYKLDPLSERVLAVNRAAVLAIVDRLAAAPPPELAIGVERLRAIEHAARDVDGLWSEGRKLIRWQAEAGEALRDLRTVLGSE